MSEEIIAPVVPAPAVDVPAAVVETPVAPIAGPTTPPAASGDPAAPPVTPAKVEAPKEPEIPEEPPVRKTALQHILDRKQKQIDKLKADQKTVIPEAPALKNEPLVTVDDLTPEDEAKFDRFMQKKYGTKLETIDQLSSQTEETHLNDEISEFLTKDPNGEAFKPFIDKIKSWAKHPSRANVPVSAIAYEIAGKKLMEIGAAQARAADKAQRDSAGTGSSNRGSNGGQKLIKEMSDTEFMALQTKVLTGGR